MRAEPVSSGASTIVAGAAGSRAENTAEGQKLIRSELMAQTTALVPLLRAKAAEAERTRRIPDEVLAAIDAAGLFRLRAPKRFGGHEADLRTYMDVITELGRGCGSTAWIAFISTATAWIAAQFSDQAQDDVFAGNPDARTIGVLAMNSRVRPVEGGYRLDGKWPYASNCLHAHWAILAVPLPSGGGMAPGIVLVPMRELTIEDTWHVVAMRGTGSNTVVADNVFVPAHRVMPVEALAKGRSPRTNTEEVIYREAFMPTAIIAVAAPVLGMAQAALELTLERVNSAAKPIAYSFYDDTRKAPSMQLELAQAATLVETAVLHRAALVRRHCRISPRGRGSAVRKTGADAHGSGLCDAVLPRSGRASAQCAGRQRFRRGQSHSTHLARHRDGKPSWPLEWRGAAGDLRPGAGRQFRAAVAVRVSEKFSDDETERRARGFVVEIDQLGQQLHQLGAVLRPQRRDDAFLRAEHRGLRALDQRIARAGELQELDPLVLRGGIAGHELARLEPFQHVAERRAVERDQCRQSRRVGPGIFADRRQRRVLHRREIELGALFHEDRYGNLLGTADQVPRHGVQIL